MFKAHTAKLLPGVDYKLTVKSRAGDAAGPLQTSFRKVKYMRVVDPAPTITSAKTRDTSEDGTVNTDGGAPLDVTGENLATATAVELLCGNEEPTLWQTVPATYADGKLSTGNLNLGAAPGSSGYIRVMTAGGSATYSVNYCAH